MPEENLIVNFINTDQDTIANRKFLSEAVVNLFNFESRQFQFFLEIINYVFKKF